MNTALIGDVQSIADGVQLADELVLHDQRLRLAMLDDVLNLRPLEPEVDGDRDQPRARQRHIHLHPLDAVVREERDAIALGQPKSQERPRKPARPLVPLAEGQRASRIARTDLLGLETSMRRDDVGNGENARHGRPRTVTSAAPGSPHPSIPRLTAILSAAAPRGYPSAQASE
jgi:hypothetical protein